MDDLCGYTKQWGLSNSHDNSPQESSDIATFYQLAPINLIEVMDRNTNELFICRKINLTKQKPQKYISYLAIGVDFASEVQLSNLPSDSTCIWSTLTALPSILFNNAPQNLAALTLKLIPIASLYSYYVDQKNLLS